MRRRLVGICASLLVLAGACASTSTGLSQASWVQPSVANPGNSVTAATVPPPAGVQAVAADAGCSSVTVSWQPSAQLVTALVVERRASDGSWIAIAEVAAGTTSVTDTPVVAGGVLEYRVWARSHGAWQSEPAVAPPLSCGGIRGLAADNPCSSVVLTWSTDAAASVDVYARVLPDGAWRRVAAAVPGPPFTDPSPYPHGADIAYRLVPAGAAPDDATAPTTTLRSWQDFRVVSITAVNAAVPGQLEPGDTLVVRFSKPVETASVTTPHSLRTRRNPTPALDIAGPAGPHQIGILNSSSNIFGSASTFKGDASARVWSDGDLAYTWTSAAGGTTQLAPLSGVFVPGTAVRCAADGSGLRDALQPQVGGSW